MRRKPAGVVTPSERSAAVTWITLHEGGVLLALAPGTHRNEIQVRIRFAGEAARRLPVESAGRHKKIDLAYAPLRSSLSAHPGSCTITVTVRGQAYHEHFEVGPELYSGCFDGIRDYRLEGWLAPLFPTTAPSVCLVVDGVSGDPVALTRYRGEFQFMVTGQGGWNGFSLPLPVSALDGKPHRLAIRAGATTLPFGTWSSQPKYNIDAVAPNHLSGWYFDPAIADAPTTLRIVRNGVTRSEIKTHLRGDVRAAFGRETAGFLFSHQDIQPESELVVGPEGSSLVLGRFGNDVHLRVREQRALARMRLLEGGRPDVSLIARRSIRARMTETERVRGHGPITFQPVIAAETIPVAADAAANRNPAPWKPRKSAPICAILPVYKGLADLKLCLASLLPQLRAGAVRAIVINDGSPDPEIAGYLAQVASENHPGLAILDNPSNLGFIGTVNRGFSLLEPDEDVLLVNADTILPPGLPERLARHCHARPGIASVTPMSNNATILSFPNVVNSSPPALGLDVAAIDRAFAEHGAAPVEIPTGVGFCIYFNRQALDEVGPFSPEWGRGYCEEVDWCLTARDLGWIHLAATDTFVLHEGSVSFGVAERQSILAINHVRLEKRYPEYLSEVFAFIRADPLEDLRTDVLLRLLVGRFKSLTLHLMHGLGGGTKRYVEDIQGLPRSADHEIAVLAPVADRGDDPRLLLSFNGAGVTLTLNPDRIERTLAAIEAAGVAIQIHVNSRLTFRSDFLAALLSGARPYTVTLHDFQWYCPRVHLTDERHTYCGEPTSSVCQLCVSGGVEHNFADHTALIENDLEAWLAFNAGILKRATRILTPSDDTARRYRRRLNLPDIVVAPHPEPRLHGTAPVVSRAGRSRGSLRIAVVGAIGRVKGFDVLVRMVERAARDRMPFFLTIVGYTSDDERLVRYKNAAVTGAYKPSELKAKLDEIDPDFVFLPSIWPETYSYVLSEVWEAGYPVVAFDIGAPAARIKAMGGGVVIPFTRDSRIILEALMGARDMLATLEPMRPEPTFVPSLDAYYRQPGPEAGAPDAAASPGAPRQAGHAVDDPNEAGRVMRAVSS
ncbi:glycosyltransferase [Methylobacterium sp. J-068]|uniref:glycosyltransferase n=1 Tax=Methylobacterium sp. J-068 TaxID=2836649 RepID=UPI001FBB61B5|nr:glycosyltransferase [Methylobacterium sp. J-068]MCJ2036159.1 glycosyltransferase [Methylobacterium sp. J-068]